jgi:hypothetical protein
MNTLTKEPVSAADAHITKVRAEHPETTRIDARTDGNSLLTFVIVSAFHRFDGLLPELLRHGWHELGEYEIRIDHPGFVSYTSRLSPMTDAQVKDSEIVSVQLLPEE